MRIPPEMILTLYYMYATVSQWWKLSVLRNKLNGTINSHNALIVCSGNAILGRQRCLENLLFHRDDRLACTVVPKRIVDLSRWISFPKDASFFPVYMVATRLSLSSQKVFVVVEAFLDAYLRQQSEVIQLENFGELFAWKAENNLEVIIKTDMDYLTKLVNCFIDHQIDINHDLNLLKIETVDVINHPMKIKYDKKFPLEMTQKYSYAPIHWNKFVVEIRELYSKINENCRVVDVNPKILIENGTKIEEVKIEAKPLKKEQKKLSLQHRRGSKNQLEVITAGRSRSDHKTKHRRDHKIRPESIQVEGSKSKPKSEPAPKETRKKSHKPKKRNETGLMEVQFKPVEGASTDGMEPVERATIRRSDAKPPNVLVYADTLMAKENVKAVLQTVLNTEKYTIYDFPTTTNNQFWNDSTILVVVCGSVSPNHTFQLLQYLLTGGQLLCLCSDLLYSVLHTFTTAEVREHELVRFSYGEWKRIKMMHHIFCYQASPVKKQFSKDSDQSSHSNGSSPIAPRTPSAVEIQHNNEKYIIQVQVLGAEETWQTPSLLLADVKNSTGRAIFSQVHLEIDPNQYQEDEQKYVALKESDTARLEIFKHILSFHLNIDCDRVSDVAYTFGYFLGRHDLKQQFLFENRHIVNDELVSDAVTLKFVRQDVDLQTPTASYFQILVHACPSNFSTVQYFEALKTETIGRLVIYADTLTSSQALLKKPLKHGVVVIPRRQTQGVGRSGNKWLSPKGCAMFSIQFHVELDSPLGKTLSLIQHLVMVAIVSSLRRLSGYECLELGLKWPNDLYARGDMKIGGIVVNSVIENGLAIVNAGCGVNLDNAHPTTCINNLIDAMELKQIAYEQFFALVFNEIESFYNEFQLGNGKLLFESYYKYWLHSGAKVMITTTKGKTMNATIVGIDEYGFLRVRISDGTETTVQPDGNTFDMLKGLIAPKIF